MCRSFRAAEAAILIVDANEGVREQTKRHAYILGMLGLEQVIAVINKMDAVNYDQKRFEAVKNDVTALLKMVAYKPEDMLFIAASAFQGANISKKSDKTPWYKGPTVLEALDTLKEPEKPTQISKATLA
jgi:elongation factor 1-alpha